MVETSTPAEVAELPPPPRNPLTMRQQIGAVKAFHTGQEMLRDAGGHVTRLKNGPAWLTPEAVLATSPRAARDILGGTGSAERTPAHDEVRSCSVRASSRSNTIPGCPVGAPCSPSSPNKTFAPSAGR